VFLKDYLRLLNEFLLNSSIGEFAARLEMLKAFSRYCKELADPVLKNRLLILDNITAFFSPSVNQKNRRYQKASVERLEAICSNCQLEGCQCFRPQRKCQTNPSSA